MTDQVNHRNWTRKRINCELKARETSQAQISEQVGRSKAMVCEVVAGRRKSQPIADAIADAIGRTPWEIWPRLYSAPSEDGPSEAPTTAPTAAPEAIAQAS